MVSTVYIAKNVYGGDGLGRLGDGRVAFVPGAYTGEQVKAEIVAEKRGYVKMRLVEVVEPSPSRIGSEPPPVPGMVYSNLAFPAELDAKESQLAEMIGRARIVPGSFSRIPADLREFGYRNKAVYTFARSGSSFVLGYKRENDGSVVDMVSDPFVCPEINRALPSIRGSVAALLTRGAEAVRRDIERKERVTVRYSQRSGIKWFLGDDAGSATMTEMSCGRAFEVPLGGFWQVNPVAADALISTAADCAAEAAPSEIADLYCGAGVFGITAALKCSTRPRVRGVEISAPAALSATKNMARHGVEGKIATGPVSRAIRNMRFAPDGAAIIDPPRGGMEKQSAMKIAAAGPRRVIYASCGPATLVRDLKILSGAYELKSLRWINMFPRTARFESLATLDRKDR